MIILQGVINRLFFLMETHCVDYEVEIKLFRIKGANFCVMSSREYIYIYIRTVVSKGMLEENDERRG